MEKRVEGIYEHVEDALRAVDTLKERGYSRDQITLVANEDTRAGLDSDLNTDVTTQGDSDMSRTEDHDRSIWESIKDAFSTNDTYDDANYDDPNYDNENDPLYPYRDSIRKGQIAVVVSGDPTGDGMLDKTTDVPPADPNVDMDDTLPGAISDVDPGRDVDATRDVDDSRKLSDDETLELREDA